MSSEEGSKIITKPSCEPLLIPEATGSPKGCLEFLGIHSRGIWALVKAQGDDTGARMGG